MKKRDLEHTLRAAGRLIGESQFIVIGSQSIAGAMQDAPAELLWSMEVDLIPKNNKKRTGELDIIGEGSSFHHQFGYYVDPVSEATAILPRGWKGRLVNFQNDNTGNVLGLCLHPDDLFVSKMAAGREKDIEFGRAMIAHAMIDRAKVQLYASTVPCPENDLMLSRRTMARIDRLFEEHSPSITRPIDEASGRYVGNILCIGETFVRQEVGRGETVLHRVDKLNRVPAVGASLAIQYKDGKASVLSKERGLAQAR